MSKPFVPHKPEKMVLCKISAREASLITKLRRYAFGKFLVHKTEGLIIRVEINDSQLISDDDASDLA